MRDSGIVSDMALVDEVESLTSARKGAASGNEPSDSLRVCPRRYFEYYRVCFNKFLEIRW